MPQIETEEERIRREALAFQASQGMRGPAGVQAPEEAGAVEGDFADYVMPFQGVGVRGIKLGARSATEAYQAAKLARAQAELAARTADMVGKGVFSSWLNP